MREKEYSYTMPTDLERHLKDLADSYPEVRELHSLWLLLRKRIEEELTHCNSVFVNYSLHDGSHSRSVIQAVERFLGEERICRLSATDTFMLLACIYSHDYGMSKTFNKIYDILGSDDFRTFLKSKEKSRQWMEKEDEQAIHNLLQYLGEEKTNIPLNDLYYSIILVVQLYLRPEHWKGVLGVKYDFEGLFEGQMKKRFIYGKDGIEEICMCHGQPIDHIFQLSYCANGMAGDKYHPRFIASMLRLGDSLDLDNGRFPMWFVREAALSRNIIPKLSLLHFRKHEAVSHLLITPEDIEITVNCKSEQQKKYGEENRQKEEVWKEKAQQDSYETASLMHEWTENLTQECSNMVKHWKDIAQPNFGQPPAIPLVKIYVDDKEYMARDQQIQMRMSQERMRELFEGTSIYEDQYVGIREMLQNAIDASLLQLWSDLLQNKYYLYDKDRRNGLSKSRVKDGLDLWDILKEKQAYIFANYDITVEVIEDRMRKKVFIIVKDRGIGITREEIESLAEIGSGREKSKRISKLMESMPAWLKPSGIFGIGLQSVFQLTNCIEIYTRQYNMPEQHIILNSYGKNRGKIEIREISKNDDEIYYDNAIPGTNVRIAIDPHKFLSKGRSGDNIKFRYYDPEFDAGEELHMLFVEAAKACENKIRETKFDYFNIYYETMRIEENGEKTSKGKRCLRRSYIYPKQYEKESFGKHLRSFPAISQEPYVFSDNMAFFWDKESSRSYLIKVQPCLIREEEERNLLSFPERVSGIYSISYKFNRITDIEALYARRGYPKCLHAGFMSMDVLILDDQPATYMNIDRDRLREGAIDEEELITAQRRIMRLWCEELCRCNEKNPIEEDEGKKKKQWDDKKGILISLVILFYRNVERELFKRFIIYFKDMVDAWGIVVENEVPIDELWNSENLFRTKLDSPVMLKQIGEKREDLEQQEAQKRLAIEAEIIQRLPHNLVRIEAVGQSGSRLWYDLRIQPQHEKTEGIDMSEEACLYDYMGAFDSYDDNPKKIKFDTLPKKIFKPDSRFENLLLPCFPRTFRKGRNMDGGLDHCIKDYILSPFSRTTAVMLGKAIKNSKEIGTEFINNVMESDQMKKCVAYIMKKRFADCVDKEEKEKTVRKDYERFLNQFYRLLMENRELVMKQFEAG